jgi:hypothetical protein
LPSQALLYLELLEELFIEMETGTLLITDHRLYPDVIVSYACLLTSIAALVATPEDLHLAFDLTYYDALLYNCYYYTPTY